MRRVRTAPRWSGFPPIPGGDDLPSIPDDLGALRQAITGRNAVLVVVDPLMAFLGGDVNSDRDQDVRRALAPLARVAEETGCAVLVLRHNSKAQQSNVLYRGGGLIGIIGAARSGLVVARTPRTRPGPSSPSPRRTSGRSCRASPTHRGRPQRRGRVDWLGPTAHTAKDLLREPPSQEERSQTDQACDVLRELLADGKVDAKQARRQVMDGAGVSSRTVDIAKARLGVIAEREGYGPGGRWVWRLP